MADTILKKWNSATSEWEELNPQTTHTQIVASGTPSSTTYLRGDGTWATVEAGTTFNGGTITENLTIDKTAPKIFMSDDVLTLGLASEVDGQLVNYGTNYNQLGSRNAAYPGSFFRIDVRDAQASEMFNVKYIPPNGTEQTVFKVSRTGDVVASSDITSGGDLIVSGSIDIAGSTLQNSNGSLVWDTDTVWNAGNDGSGSGLDADLLDGFDLTNIVGIQGPSDYVNGTLVATNIDYSQFAGESFQVEIEGKSYGQLYPWMVRAQGYIYADTIINQGIVDYTGNFPAEQFKAFNLFGNLCFWWPRQSYWNNFAVKVYSSVGGLVSNRVTSITDSVIPAGRTKEVGFNVVRSITSSNIGSQTVNNSNNLGGRGSDSYMYYRGVNIHSDFQTFQSTANIVRFDQINDSSGMGNKPPGYTYGGVISARGDNFGFQLWGSHLGDLYYKTQWQNDQYSGWRNIWNSGNFDPGSKLSISGGTLTGRTYSQEWIEFPNYTGLYSPNNSAHFNPNPHSYGAWYITGSRNGWGGLEFGAGNGHVSLMISSDSNTIGTHNNSYGWQTMWQSGSFYVFKNAYGGGTQARVWDGSNLTFSLSGSTLSIGQS